MAKQTLKYRILAWRAKRLANRQPRPKKYVDYAQARNILLLYASTTNEQDGKVQHIVRQLAADGKKTTVCYYAGAERGKSLPADELAICEKKTDMTGKPAQAIKALADKHFDLVIDLTCTPCLPLLYILLYANALCKAGCGHTDIPLLDFIIAQPHTHNAHKQFDINNLYEQILFYLKNIRSND